MKMVPTYLLNGDDKYKILILYILRTLNIDIKREIYDLLLIEEIIELDRINELIEQNWQELTIQNIYELYDLCSEQ